MLVLDASGSMKEPDGAGSTKIASAKSAMAELVAGLDDGQQVGLRLFGAKVSGQNGANQAKACRDTQLALPVAALDRAAITKVVNGITPLGETPIGLALQKAAADLPAGTGGSVVLVSDGEDSCAPKHGPEPCAVAKQLAASGVKIAVQTVGLRVDAKARAQLTCIAEATGGTYTDVTDVTTLGKTLATAVARGKRAGDLGNGTPLEGGADRFAAPTIESGGVYADTIVRNEKLWFGFSWAQGQRARVRLSADGRDLDEGKFWVSLDLYREDDLFLCEGCADSFSIAGNVGSAEAVGPVVGVDTYHSQVREAGDHYAVVRVTGLSQGTEVPFEIRLEIEDAAGSVTPSASGSGSAAASAPASSAATVTPEPVDDSGTPSRLLIGGGVGLAALGGIGGFVAGRLSRASGGTVVGGPPTGP